MQGVQKNTFCNHQECSYIIVSYELYIPFSSSMLACISSREHNLMYIFILIHKVNF